MEQLNHATEMATEVQFDRAGNALQMADNEIARFRAILAQIDELENELEKIKKLGGHRSTVPSEGGTDGSVV